MNSIVDWFVKNPIASNLLMLLIVLGGVNSFFNIDKQFFPDREVNKIEITVPYLGAGPAEVEQQICIRLEEAVSDLDGIEEIVAVAQEGSGSLSITVESGYDTQRLLNEVKSRVDAISTFPGEAERPQVVDVKFKKRMISLALSGHLSESSLKELGLQLRDELAALPDIQLVELTAPRDYELAIEVSEFDLQRYGLEFEDVVQAIRGSSLNLPAGKIRSNNGDIQVQTRGQSYVASDFEKIILISKNDGTQIFLGDVATVVDGFVEEYVDGRFDAKSTLSLDVYVTTRPNVLKTSETVHKFVADVKDRLPPTVELAVWRDMSKAYKSRLGSLQSNGLGGLALVFIVLMLFLHPLLAMWVCVGIAVSFLGAFWLLPVAGSSLNMPTMFAFILILGIVVDDAIIVGESIHAQQEAGITDPSSAAAKGAKSVLKPVWFAVVSTMLFFAPLLILPIDFPGPRDIAIVVIIALAFSLIECMAILPSHLANMRPEKKHSHKKGLLAGFESLRKKCSDGMTYFSENIYRPFLERCMAWRSLTLISFAMVFLIVISILLGGWMKHSFFPKVPIDFMVATAVLPKGIASEEVAKVLDQIEHASYRLRDQLNEESDVPVIGRIQVVGRTNSVYVTLELLDVEGGDKSNTELKHLWEKEIGELRTVEDFSIRYTFVSLGKAIDIQLSASSVDTLAEVSAGLRAELARYPGVFNIGDSLENPRPEIALKLKPQAEMLNVSLSDLAQQVRRGFYGEEVQRIPRKYEDVRVMVRYPSDERASEAYLRDMRIRTPSGMEVPFETVAEIDYVPSYQEIKRIDRKRTVSVTAEVLPGYASANSIVRSISKTAGAKWEAIYPDLNISVAGEMKERSDFNKGMTILFVGAMLIIYGLIAIAFSSYWQPILVLAAIPFGITGAVIGHIIMGIDLSMLSYLGMVACAGVVVNDNLVLVDRVNALRATGLSLKEALLEGTKDRFRPIILTSLTTFIGLLPIMSETSMQAKFLVPMVVSLAFGVLAATVVTLLFTPILYLQLQGIIDRIKAMCSWLIKARSV